MYYDYYGFPPESYRVTWPTPGDPALAARVRGLLEDAKFVTAEDAQRGYDHGTFVPLKLAYPDARIPVVQLSLIEGLDPEAHLRMGRALAPLRDEGVFVIASGRSPRRSTPGCARRWCCPPTSATGGSPPGSTRRWRATRIPARSTWSRCSSRRAPQARTWRAFRTAAPTWGFVCRRTTSALPERARTRPPRAPRQVRRERGL